MGDEILREGLEMDRWRGRAMVSASVIRCRRLPGSDRLGPGCRFAREARRRSRWSGGKLAERAQTDARVGEDGRPQEGPQSPTQDGPLYSLWATAARISLAMPLRSASSDVQSL